MRLLKRHLLPRWAKIMLNLFLTAMALGLLYIFTDAPVFSATQAFRRVEKQNLVGPSKVLAILDISDEHFKRLLIADDGKGVVMFPIYEKYSRSTSLYYREKTGPVTVIAAPTSREPDKIETLTIIMFGDMPDSASAELTLTLSAPKWTGVEFTKDYTLTAEREYNGFFRFELRHTNGDEYYEAESYAFSELSKTTDYFSNQNVSIPATVSLFDRSGGLIYKQNMILPDK